MTKIATGTVPRNSGVKCSRTACTSMNACCMHKETHRLYCPRCRHAINRFNPDLVLSPSDTKEVERLELLAEAEIAIDLASM